MCSYFNLTKTLENDNTEYWYEALLLEDTYIRTHFEKDSGYVTNTNSLSKIRELNLWIYPLYAKADFKFSKSMKIVATTYWIPIRQAILYICYLQNPRNYSVQ